MNPASKTRHRLDKHVVELGLAPSRERARALILAGSVLVNGVPVTKAGITVPLDAEITLKTGDMPYVSRGGLKLEAAMRHFEIDVRDKTVADVGASTGGFTHYLLKNGARRVYAVDVGYGQLAWSLRNHERVVVLERRNIRFLKPEDIGEEVDMAVIDVSFISLTLVLPAVGKLLKPGGEIVALVKPQFEVGKGQVGKGGIVKDPGLQRDSVEKIRAFAKRTGLETLGEVESPIAGAKGNREFFLYLRRRKGWPSDGKQ